MGIITNNQLRACGQHTEKVQGPGELIRTEHRERGQRYHTLEDRRGRLARLIRPARQTDEEAIVEWVISHTEYWPSAGLEGDPLATPVHSFGVLRGSPHLSTACPAVRPTVVKSKAEVTRQLLTHSQGTHYSHSAAGRNPLLLCYTNPTLQSACCRVPGSPENRSLEVRDAGSGERGALSFVLQSLIL